MFGAIRGLIVFPVVLVLSIWIFSSLPSWKECVKNHNEQAAQGQYKEDITAFGIPLGPYRDCVGRFVHDNKDEILAAFTVILAFATILLWFATRDLVLGAERTARQQLRAYVFVSAAKLNISGRSLESFVVDLIITNTGQTPAFDVVVSAYSKTLLPNEVRSFNPPRDQIRLHSKFALGAGGQGGNQIDVRPIVTDAGLQAMRDGKWRFLYLGRLNTVTPLSVNGLPSLGTKAADVTVSSKTAEWPRPLKAIARPRGNLM